MSFYNLIPWNRKSVPAKREELSDTQVHSLHQDINRLFDEFFGRNESLFSSGFGELAGMPWERSELNAYPRIDFHESEKEFRISAELPGMSEEDIELNLSDDVLMIKGEKKEEKVEDDKGWYRMERRYGSFSRVIPLPSEVDSAAVSASMKNGVLRVTLPKKVEQKKAARSITINK